MIRRATVVVHVETGTPRLGLWCDRCLLPSVVEVPLLRLQERGVSRIGTVRQCMEAHT